MNIRTVQEWLGHESLATTPGAVEGDGGAAGGDEAAVLDLGNEYSEDPENVGFF
jgi:hypothetical protein